MIKAEKHSDCMYYTPIDVAKGKCVRINDVVTLESGVCGYADIKPKCKYCLNFTEEVCSGFDKESWVYGELGAENCEKFSQR